MFKSICWYVVILEGKNVSVLMGVDSTRLWQQCLLGSSPRLMAVSLAPTAAHWGESIQDRAVVTHQQQEYTTRVQHTKTASYWKLQVVATIRPPRQNLLLREYYWCPNNGHQIAKHKKTLTRDLIVESN